CARDRVVLLFDYW
nr:immunoglobulin heavy chain junction region [Macaca mulatta]